MILKPCPFCQKKIPSRMALCPYCRRDDSGKEILVESAITPEVTAAAKTALEGLAASDPFLRKQAEEAVIKQGPLVVEELLKIIGGPTSPMMLSTARILGKMRERRAIPAIRALLRSGSDEQRAVALGALAQFNDADVLDKVDVAALQDPTLESYYAYLWGNLRDERGVAQLRPLLQHRRTDVVFHAVYALGEIGSTKAVSLLKKTFRRKDTLIRAAVDVAVKKLGSLGIKSKRILWVIVAGIVVAVMTAVLYGGWRLKHKTLAEPSPDVSWIAAPQAVC